MIGEPLDAGGVRLRLMAEDLSDLPEKSVEYAITAWGRGDKSHLSSYQQDHTRIGVFFPKPSEVREIATFYLKEERQKERNRELAEQRKRDEQHRREHPEEYSTLGKVLLEFVERTGRRDLLPRGRSPKLADHKSKKRRRKKSGGL
jgi:hypothetical protein